MAAAPRLSADEYTDGVLAGDRAVLARAITLVESRLESDWILAQEVLSRIAPHTGGARRVGISGLPGVGKSTLIERLGQDLVADGHRLAVLAVDPSSSVSGGSLLGDKTRMPQLARSDAAYIRPSPSALSLGGVTRRTRETMMLCEAAGFDVVFVETVGVGQSETLVADMVDFFLVLMLPGAGDELQGMKKGLLELADVIAVNKADGATREAAEATRRDYEAALHFAPPRPTWTPRAVAISAATGAGVAELWQLIEDHRAALEATGELDKLRSAQLRRWMHAIVDERLHTAFWDHPRVAALAGDLEQAVVERTTSPARAAAELLTAFGVGNVHDD